MTKAKRSQTHLFRQQKHLVIILCAGEEEIASSLGGSRTHPSPTVGFCQDHWLPRFHAPLLDLATLSPFRLALTSPRKEGVFKIGRGI